MQGYCQRLSAHARILLLPASKAFYEHNKTGNDSPGKDSELAVWSHSLANEYLHVRVVHPRRLLAIVIK